LIYTNQTVNTNILLSIDTLYNIILVRPRTRISLPVPANSSIKVMKDVPLEVTCLSTGGYPQPTVNLFKYWSGQSPLRITQRTTIVVLKQNLYDVTERCTFTPTQADDGAILYCESSYIDELTFRAKSDEIQLQLLCK